MEPNTPTYTPTVAPQNSSLVPRLVLIGVLLLVIAGIVYGIFHFTKREHTAPATDFFSAGTQLVLAATAFPAINALEIVLPKGEIAPFALDAQGTSGVQGVASTDTYSYYLISVEAQQTNVYRQEHAASEAGLSQLTNSTTTKADLTADSVSERVAFIAKGEQDTQPRVTVWTADTGERDLGEGIRPVIMPGGEYVIFERNSELVSGEVSTGTVYPLVTLAPNTPWVVHPAKAVVALYEEGNVVHYNIAAMTEATRVTTVPLLGSIPQSMFYVDDLLFFAHMEGDTLLLRNQSESVSIPAPGLSLAGLSVRALGHAAAPQ